MSDGAVRVALLCPPDDPEVSDLRAGLEARGHAVKVIPARIPLAAVALQRRRFDLAHAFSLPDAAAAARWSSRTGRPAVWSLREEPDRATLASRRGRFDLVRSAVGGVRAVVAPDRRVADACRRWLGAEAEVIDPRDAAGHEELYRRLVR